MPAVLLTTYAFTCDKCGLGQCGDLGVTGDREKDLAAGRRWDGRTLVQAPKDSKPACPNCPKE